MESPITSDDYKPGNEESYARDGGKPKHTMLVRCTENSVGLKGRWLSKAIDVVRVVPSINLKGKS